MDSISRVRVAEGISAVLPRNWEYRAEGDSDGQVLSITMSNGSCNASLELLNPTKGRLVHEYISDYKFGLMSLLTGIGVMLQPSDPRWRHELLGRRSDIPGNVVHTLLETNPVVHLSAIAKNDSDLAEFRLIADSIEVISTAFDTDSEDEILPMQLSEEWSPVNYESY